MYCTMVGARPGEILTMIGGGIYLLICPCMRASETIALDIDTTSSFFAYISCPTFKSMRGLTLHPLLGGSLCFKGVTLETPIGRLDLPSTQRCLF